jgi:glycosyltransferase involved in cell wall biosynthesis
MKEKKLLFLVSEDWYFWSHRVSLAQEAKKRGYKVIVATRVNRHGNQILDLGLHLIPIKMQRRSLNPLRELLAIKEIINIYRKEKPDIVHHVAIKPVLYGSIAAYIAGIRNIINAVTGLGYVFSSNSVKACLIRPFVTTGLAVLLNRKRSRLILQNKDDYYFFVRKRIINEDKICLIRGSGVDTHHFCRVSKASEVPVVILISRMSWQKGIGEFIEAARILKKEGLKARFVLVGDADPHNPAMIKPAQLKKWREEGVIEWLGYRDNTAELFSQSDVACLPSYREGLPKVLLEAAACGLPIVASDVAGCREIVRHQENGLLVPAKDAPALAKAIKHLIENPALRDKMGEQGRNLVIKEFAVEKVIDETIALYEELLSE